jgi:dTDP-4-dehydrorhamnose reductase
LFGLGAKRKPGESGIFHFANANATSWHGFATRVLERARALGFELRTRTIEAISTSELPKAAARPGYSVLATQKIERALSQPSRSWDDALRAYLTSVRQSQVSRELSGEESPQLSFTPNGPKSAARMSPAQ